MIEIIIQDEFSHILTKNKGTVLLKDVTIGDLVKSEDNQWHPVTNIERVNYTGKVYHLVLNTYNPVFVTPEQYFPYINVEQTLSYKNLPTNDFYRTYIGMKNIDKLVRHGKIFNVKYNQIQNINKKDSLLTPVNFGLDYSYDLDSSNISIDYNTCNKYITNENYNSIDIITDINKQIFGTINIEKYRIHKANQLFIHKPTINICTNLIYLLGYLYLYSECNFEYVPYPRFKNGVLQCSCKFFIHQAYISIAQEILLLIRRVFGKKYMLYADYIFTMIRITNAHLVNILYNFSQRIPDWFHALPPKVQLHIFKSIFKTQENELLLSFSTNNAALFYDLINILNRNYIYPMMCKRSNDNAKHFFKYYFVIPRIQSCHLKDFLFKNKNYRISVNSLSGVNMPVFWNSQTYLKYPLQIRHINDVENATAVNLTVEDNRMFMLNNYLTRC